MINLNLLEKQSFQVKRYNLDTEYMYLYDNKCDKNLEVCIVDYKLAIQRTYLLRSSFIIYFLTFPYIFRKIRQGYTPVILVLSPDNSQWSTIGQSFQIFKEIVIL